MAQLIRVSWRDIPAQIIVKSGRQTARLLLSQRFQSAIDRAAMRAGKGQSEAYLADWKRSEPQHCEGDIHALAEAEVADLEAQYSDDRLQALIRAKGLDVDVVE